MDCDDSFDLPDDLKFPCFEPIPIPEELHSCFEEGPFTKCTACSHELDTCDLYEIQKVFRGTQCIFEMAICHGCGEDVSREFSEESFAAMKGFLLCRFKPTIESDHCHFCGLPRPLFKNFTQLGICGAKEDEKGSQLIVPSIIMCETCGESLQECLSEKTRDVQGDFVRDYFPGIPADFDFSPVSFPI